MCITTIINHYCNYSPESFSPLRFPWSQPEVKLTPSPLWSAARKHGVGRPWHHGEHQNSWDMLGLMEVHDQQIWKVWSISIQSFCRRVQVTYIFVCCPNHLWCKHVAVGPRPCCVYKIHKETREAMGRRKQKECYHCTIRTLTSGLTSVISNQ